MNLQVTRYVLAALLPVAAGLAAGCSQTPTAPAPRPAPSPGGNPAPPSLTGTVINSAGFSLSDAVVESVDDQGVKTSAATDRAGRYYLKVPSAGAITLRASKEGYSSSEYRVDLPRHGAADFVLDFMEQSVALRGEYQVTFTADSACVQLPAGVRTRTYNASLAPQSPGYYVANLRAGVSPAGSFVAWVDGPVVNFAANDSETFVHERLGASAFLLIDFVAGNAPVDQPNVTLPMVGTFEYCADASASDQFQCRVPRVTCRSAKHTFTLTRR
jgi:hypothetical protein